MSYSWCKRDLCEACEPFGYCVQLSVPLVTNKEMDDPAFIRDVREYLAELPVSSWAMRDYLIGGYRDALGEAYHPLTLASVSLDISAFVVSDHREWFRDLCEPIPADHKPYILPKTRDRFRVMATILRLMDPKGTASWGLRAANDNEKRR